MEFVLLSSYLNSRVLVLCL